MRRKKRFTRVKHQDYLHEQYKRLGLAVIRGIRKITKPIEKKRRK